MGLLSRKKKPKQAPEGWVTAEALVDEVESLKTRMPTSRGGSEGNDEQKLNFRVKYVLEDQSGKLVEVEEKRKYWTSEAPTQGDRMILAYDPNGAMADFKVLEDTELHRWRKLQDTRRLINEGAEAPVVVTGVTATGRVARPKVRIMDLMPSKPGVQLGGLKRGDLKLGDVNPARVANEVQLSLKVSPAGGKDFEITRRYWDRQMDLKQGSEGILFYDPADPEQGVPHFPNAEEKQLGGNAVGTARQSFVDGVSKAKVPREYRI